ncbi:hypothetical protein EDC01DRAFT_634112 [Geopyxis carbonaria]|nr:hypothetical protein EDC01DRAFT_634112 [Geopyxis carbonaria]
MISTNPSSYAQQSVSYMILQAVLYFATIGQAGFELTMILGGFLDTLYQEAQLLRKTVVYMALVIVMYLATIGQTGFDSITIVGCFIEAMYREIQQLLSWDRNEPRKATQFKIHDMFLSNVFLQYPFEKMSRELIRRPNHDLVLARFRFAAVWASEAASKTREQFLIVSQSDSTAGQSQLVSSYSNTSHEIKPRLAPDSTAIECEVTEQEKPALILRFDPTELPIISQDSVRGDTQIDIHVTAPRRGVVTASLPRNAKKKQRYYERKRGEEIKISVWRETIATRIANAMS